MIDVPASLLVVLIPAIAALPAYIFRRWRSFEMALALGACGLVLLLLAQPAEGGLKIALFNIETGGSLNLLGRILRVRATDQLALALLFSAAAVLFALSWQAPQGWSFVPVGLGMLSLFSLGLLIRPFIFAGLAFELAAALGAVMIQSERVGELSTSAAVRYLILSTLALPAFLGAGYVISQADGIADPALQMASYQPAALLLAIGFSLIFGAIPLYTWISGVANQASPLITAFVATVVSGALTFLYLEFCQEFTWFAGDATVRAVITLCGIGTLLLGGIVGWAQRSYGRILACGLSVELGATLLMLANGSKMSVEAAVFSIAARAVSLGLLGVGLTLLRRRVGGDDFERLRGYGRLYPWATLAIALGGLSLAGLPGTVGFVSRWLDIRVIGAGDLEVVMILILSGVSVGWATLRGLFSLLAEPPGAADQPESRGATVAAALAALAVVVLGLSPGIIASLAKNIAAAYTFYR